MLCSKKENQKPPKGNDFKAMDNPDRRSEKRAAEKAAQVVCLRRLKKKVFDRARSLVTGGG